MCNVRRYDSESEGDLLVKVWKTADIVLIVLLVVFAGVFYFVFGLQGDSGTPGDIVVIRINGSDYSKIPLFEDNEIDIHNTSGIHINTLRIENGRAIMVYADCPDKLCVERGAVSHTGEIIVCLPNRVVVEITGRQSEYDAIVQ